jgi:hypothetical protein
MAYGGHTVLPPPPGKFHKAPGAPCFIRLTQAAGFARGQLPVLGGSGDELGTEHAPRSSLPCTTHGQFISGVLVLFLFYVARNTHGSLLFSILNRRNLFIPETFDPPCAERSPRFRLGSYSTA